MNSLRFSLLIYSALAAAIIVALATEQRLWIGGFLLLTVTALLPLSLRWWSIPRRQRDCFEVILPVAAYMYFGMGVRGAALCLGLASSPYEQIATDNPAIIETFIAGTLAFAGLYIGYLWFGKRRAFRGSAGVIRSGGNDPHGLALICCIYGFLAFAAALYFYTRFGNASDLSDPSNLVKLSARGGLYPITGMLRLAYIGLFVCVAELSVRRAGVLLRAGAVINALAIGTWFIIGSGKETLVLPVLGIFAIRNYLHRRINIWIPVLLLGLLFAMYPLLFSYRYEGERAVTSNNVSMSQGFQMALERSHHFDMTALVIERTKSWQDLKFGSTLLELFYFPVPRALWPSKPDSFGYLFGAEYLGDEYQLGVSGGETPSMIGELFLNFHFVGDFLGMLIFGFALRRMYDLVRNGSTSPLKVATYALFLANAVHLVEGPIASHASTFLVDAAPIFLLYASDRWIFNRHQTLARWNEQWMRISGMHGASAVPAEARK